MFLESRFVPVDFDILCRGFPSHHHHDRSGSLLSMPVLNCWMLIQCMGLYFCLCFQALTLFRGNIMIDYSQLGMKHKLCQCEVHLNW